MISCERAIDDVNSTQLLMRLGFISGIDVLGFIKSNI